MKPTTKWLFTINVLTSLTLGLSSIQTPAQDATVLHDDKERLSYALGMDLGQQLHRTAVDVDPQLFARGLGDGLAGDNTLMTHDEALAAIATLQENLKRRQMEKAMLRQPQSGQASQSPQPVQQ